MEMFSNTITKEDRRYQVSWPWRTQNQNLSEKYELSLGSLKTQMKGFEKDRDLRQRYDEIIKDQLSKGVIEKAEEKNGNRKHYIPHHAIATPEKSTIKVRVVYDAPAKTKAKKMPTSRSSDFGRSLWFGTEIQIKRIGIIADIEKAFLQVRLHQGDRHITRFLWLKDINGKVTDDNMQIY